MAFYLVLFVHNSIFRWNDQRMLIEGSVCFEWYMMRVDRKVLNSLSVIQSSFLKWWTTAKQTDSCMYLSVRKAHLCTISLDLRCLLSSLLSAYLESAIVLRWYTNLLLYLVDFPMVSGHFIATLHFLYALKNWNVWILMDSMFYWQQL